MPNPPKQQQIAYTTILNGPRDEHSIMFLRVYLICVSLDLSQVPLSTTLKNDILNLINLWPWPLTLNFDLDLITGWKATKCDDISQFITAWPWTLTYNLDL